MPVSVPSRAVLALTLLLIACSGASEDAPSSEPAASGAASPPAQPVSSRSATPDGEAATGESQASSHASGAPAGAHAGAHGGQPNRLIHEKSPYLQQHAYNPVDWHPWGEEAFAKARAENKPVFLSVGYSTCHWCHVMERESFENEETAALMNEYYVSIKVDREERPDVDKVYMSATQAITGRGGWPMSVWMTPEGKPFFAGTYFPPDERRGMPAFGRVLTYWGELWRANPDSLLNVGGRLAAHMQALSEQAATVALSDETIERAARQLSGRFDSEFGGFGPAPKFPRTHALSFLMRYAHRTDNENALGMVEKTLDAMAQGGLADQLGGGFHRYSVDKQWLVPHFEKMLYDQGLIAQTYLEAYQATGHERYADVVRGILAYVARDMTDPSGAFYSAEDADSEGEEGTFYVWTPAQIIEVLGAELGARFNRVYGVTETGNFEHATSILHLSAPIAEIAREMGEEPAALEAELADARQRLLAARTLRERPHLDAKIITGWNGMMISALARAASILEAPEYADAAERAALFVLENLRDADGLLLRRYIDGEAAHAGVIDDYAYLSNALVDLYEATFNARYLDEAVRLAELMLVQFWDEENAGFLFQGEASEQLLVNTREAYDGARPSGNSIAALALLRLEHLTGDSRLGDRGREVVDAFSSMIERAPQGLTQMLVALDFDLGPTLEVVIAGEPDAADTRAMLRAIHQRFIPNKVVAVRPSGAAGEAIASLAPFVAEQRPLDGRATAYVCRNHACKLPTDDPAAMLRLIEEEIAPN